MMFSYLNGQEGKVRATFRTVGQGPTQADTASGQPLHGPNPSPMIVPHWDPFVLHHMTIHN